MRRLDLTCQFSLFFPKSIRRFYWDRFWNSYWAKVELEEQGPVSASIRHSERAELLERISEKFPFSSLLEVGCGWGQNIELLARSFPLTSISGIDIDSERLKATRTMLESNTIRNVELFEMSLCSMDAFADQQFDLVLASAVLLYIPENEIHNGLREIIRVAKKGILLLEQDRPEGYSESKDARGEKFYLRNYDKLLREVAPGCKILRKSIPRPRWITEEWKQYATLYIVDKFERD